MIIASLVLTLVSIALVVVLNSSIAVAPVFVCSVLALIFAAIILGKNKSERVGAATLLVVNIGLIMLSLAGLASGNRHSAIPENNGKSTALIDKDTPPPTPVSTTEKKINLSEKEIAVLTASLYDDIRGTIHGAGAFGNSYKECYPQITFNITADQYQKEYDANVAAADLKYLGKTGVVTGTVANVEKGIDQQYYIVMKAGTDSYTQPKARMADGFLEYVAALSKKEKIAIFCIGGGMGIGSAELNQCYPPDDAAKLITSSIVSWLESGNTISATLQSVVVVGVSVTEMLLDTSPCFSVEGAFSDECQDDLKNTLTDWRKANDPLAWRELGAKTAKRLGFDWDKIGAELKLKDGKQESKGQKSGDSK